MALVWLICFAALIAMPFYPVYLFCRSRYFKWLVEAVCWLIIAGPVLFTVIVWSCILFFNC